MSRTVRILAATLALAGVFAAGVAVGQNKNKYGTPKTIVHLVALKWKDAVSDADKQKALDGIKAMAADIPGIKNVWLKTIRAQGADAVFAIEFQDQAAADRYRDHPAHTAWEKFYLPLRQNSTSFQATN